MRPKTAIELRLSFELSRAFREVSSARVFGATVGYSCCWYHHGKGQSRGVHSLRNQHAWSLSCPFGGEDTKEAK